MPVIAFDHLPDHARLWTFAAERPLAAGERERLLARVDAFLETWNAHRVPLTAARDWRYDRFLLVAVDEPAAGVSGCSIDALTHELRALESELRVTLLETAPVFFRDGDTIRRVSRDEFRALARSGAVQGDTTVFDNTVTTVGDLRARWETTARRSWHARAFSLSENGR